MRIGVSTFLTDQTIGPARLAAEVEGLGFEALFIPEHTNIPVDADLVHEGSVVPDYYKRTYDPFVALTVAATASTTLTLGTGICLVAQRDPIVTAKQVATLDRVSGGRLVFGVGFGWNREEAEAHGVIWKRRFSTARQKVLAMKALWTEEVAVSDHEFADFPRCWQWPKPAQSPHPRIYVGGDGPTSMRHAAEWGDAWYPWGRPGATFEKRVPEFLALAEGFGRDPATLGVGIAAAQPDPRVLDHYREVGVERVILRVPPGTADEVRRTLESFATAVGVLA